MRTTQWEGTLTALSSIAHGGETRGTITLLRRELVCSSSGELVHVPIVSGRSGCSAPPGEGRSSTVPSMSARSSLT